MKKYCMAMIAAGVLTLSQQGMAQSRADVSYQCEGGKSVNVNYAFNKQGVPTSATVKIKGKKRKLAYDLDDSDDEMTYFRDRQGYEISADYMDEENYREAGVMILSPKSEILYKACVAKKGKSAKKSSGPVRDAKTVSSQGRVRYRCLNDSRLEVDYRFNAAGVPVSASASLDGKTRTLNYDLNTSNDVDTNFTGQGYTLSSSYMDTNNFRNQSVMVMDASSQFLYKDCDPLR